MVGFGAIAPTRSRSKLRSARWEGLTPKTTTMEQNRLLRVAVIGDHYMTRSTLAGFAAQWPKGEVTFLSASCSRRIETICVSVNLLFLMLPKFRWLSLVTTAPVLGGSYKPPRVFPLRVGLPFIARQISVLGNGAYFQFSPRSSQREPVAFALFAPCQHPSSVSICHHLSTPPIALAHQN